MKWCLCFLTLAVLSQACENREVASEITSEEETAIEADDEAAFEGEADQTQTLPSTNEKEEGNGGIISGGVKPDAGRQLCQWLKPIAGEKKSWSYYGCQISPAFSATELRRATLRTNKGQTINVIERKTNYRGYATVFVVADSVRELSAIELILKK